MAGKGRLSKKGAINRNQLRDLFTEQLMRAVEHRGFVGQMFEMLDEIKDPDKKLGRAIELMKFVMPQLAAQKIEVEQTGAQVERIVFQPIAAPKAIDKSA